MKITLDWLGCATFRLIIDDLVIFLDAYIDRVPTAPPVGITTADVDRADFILVGHSHFDHLAGAEIIAAKTGARIIGSNETCRVMRECGVPDAQLLPSQGGERHRLSADVTVRVFPSLHAVLWTGYAPMGEPRSGDLGLCEDERQTMGAKRAGAALMGNAPDPVRAATFGQHLRSATGSLRDGGALVYLIDTPIGSIFFQDTSGCWSPILRSIRADVAILAVAARANLDGEPLQSSTAEFVAQEAAWLGAQTVVIGHHDNWLGMDAPDVQDVTPVRTELARLAPDANLLEVGYVAGTPLFE
jgi:L-ascorbate metabolism protein UlaG (beta-lactamase superfamily)